MHFYFLCYLIVLSFQPTYEELKLNPSCQWPLKNPHFWSLESRHIGPPKVVNYIFPITCVPPLFQ